MIVSDTLAVVKAAEVRIQSIEGILSEIESELIELQQQGLQITTKSSELDLVTQADVLSEQRLIAFIRSNFPQDGVIAEEGGQSSTEESRRERFMWILDPIDGTVNYANRLPGWAISIGLLYCEERVGGLVSAPVLGERFKAIWGCGATLNGNAIHVSTRVKLRDGLVATGFPYDRDKKAEFLSSALANILRLAGGLRRIGSAALDICYVADGRFIGYYEMGLKPWDSAAATLIAEEAGATLTALDGSAFELFASPGSVLLTNGHVHTDMEQAVEPILHAL